MMIRERRKEGTGDEGWMEGMKTGVKQTRQQKIGKGCNLCNLCKGCNIIKLINQRMTPALHLGMALFRVEYKRDD